MRIDEEGQNYADWRSGGCRKSGLYPAVYLGGALDRMTAVKVMDPRWVCCRRGDGLRGKRGEGGGRTVMDEPPCPGFTSAGGGHSARK